MNEKGVRIRKPIQKTTIEKGLHYHITLSMENSCIFGLDKCATIWNRAEKASRLTAMRTETVCVDEKEKECVWIEREQAFMANKQLENNGIVYNIQKDRETAPTIRTTWTTKENEKMLLRTIGSQIAYMMMFSSIFFDSIFFSSLSSLSFCLTFRLLLYRHQAHRHHHHLFHRSCSFLFVIWCDAMHASYH